jgi:hypothetical protein
MKEPAYALQYRNDGELTFGLRPEEVDFDLHQRLSKPFWMVESFWLSCPLTEDISHAVDRLRTFTVTSLEESLPPGHPEIGAARKMALTPDELASAREQCAKLTKSLQFLAGWKGGGTTFVESLSGLGFSNQEILKILGVVDGVCHRCWNSKGGCGCER